jgi:hypothetical protein
MPLRNAWSPQLPSLGDFILSPGFGGGLVLLAAVIVLIATSQRVNKRLGQQDKHHQELRADAQRRETIERCWARLVWLINTAGTEPADLKPDEPSLVLGPELALAIIEGLQRDAKELADETLAEAVSVYLTQYGLVLGQRIGSLPDPAPVSNGHSGQQADAANPVSTTTIAVGAVAKPSKEGQK